MESARASEAGKTVERVIGGVEAPEVLCRKESFFLPGRWPAPSRAGIPLTPLPIALAVDTLFYWAIIAALVGIRWAVRRHRRRRYGRCTACGHARAGPAADRKCPECGTALTTTPTT
jgi:hypothetical protein